MESAEPFGDEMPNFDICGASFKELFEDIDALDVDAKTETAASSEDSGRKSTENEHNPEKTMKWKSSTGSRLLKTLTKELRVLFLILKPGTTINMVGSSCC